MRMHSSSTDSMHKLAFMIAISLFIFLVASEHIHADPVGPLVTYVRNETAVNAPATMINTTGGSVATLRLNGTTQNRRWKSFVGNITGTLVLDDARNNTVFEWALATVSGEVYATRTPNSINWTRLNCTWGVTGSASNRSVEEFENYVLNHSSSNDNITTTFSTRNHTGFYVGTRFINQNACYSVHTFVNDSAQNSYFQEILLYDGTNSSNGNIVYTSVLENDQHGFNNETVDFQLIVPDNGAMTWNSAVPYYFYAELS